jgi:hypothetical protein
VPSVPSLAEPAVAPRRNRSATAAPPADDRRRPNDPFARKSSAKVADDWTRGRPPLRRVRGGLWWVRASIPFFLMPVLALTA